MLRAALAIGSCGASYYWRSFTSFGIRQLFYGSNFIDRIVYSLSLAFLDINNVLYPRHQDSYIDFWSAITPVKVKK